mmetsp:Transcript_50665/g.83997  ORF Transcript_50665/g.83997 Transcript_50665/m.83997 type:complete len:106 (-) Transcript_50665:66-383(-)
MQTDYGAALDKAMFRSALRRNIGSGATVIAKHAAVTNGNAPGATDPLQLISNILLARSGEAIRAAALVDVKMAKLRERTFLPADERATRLAVAVSAAAAPARFIM